MTGFLETGDHALGESSRYLQASGGRRNFGIKPARYHFVIRAILKHEKSLKDMDFSDGWDHSHSMVPMGFGVRSSRTRLMPSTSCVIRSVILCSTA